LMKMLYPACNQTALLWGQTARMGSSVLYCAALQSPVNRNSVTATFIGKVNGISKING